MSFTTATANERVIITFSTGCVVTSGKGFVEIEILVDPAGSVGEFVSPPTNQVNSAGSLLCLGDASATSAGAGAGATVVASVRPAVAGTNTVRVREFRHRGARQPGGHQVLRHVTGRGAVRRAGDERPAKEHRRAWRRRLSEVSALHPKDDDNACLHPDRRRRRGLAAGIARRRDGPDHHHGAVRPLGPELRAQAGRRREAGLRLPGGNPQRQHDRERDRPLPLHEIYMQGTMLSRLASAPSAACGSSTAAAPRSLSCTLEAIVANNGFTTTNTYPVKSMPASSAAR